MDRTELVGRERELLQLDAALAASRDGRGQALVPIGHSNQLRHVFSTQTLWQRKPLQMRITIDGTPGPHVTAKDIVLAIISRIGIGGASGHAVDYCGSRSATCQSKPVRASG